MALFEDLNKAIKDRYTMIEKAVEAENNLNICKEQSREWRKQLLEQRCEE